MFTREESVSSALRNFIGGYVDNQHDIIYEDDRETGRFYLTYDDESKPYIVMMRNETMVVLDVATWKSIIEVEKDGSKYSFPVMRVNVPKSVLIGAYKELASSCNPSEVK